MKLFAFGIRVLYRLFCLFPQQDRIAFMSRQGVRPFDFELLEPELAKRLPSARIVWVCGAETTGGPQIALTFRQLWHAATSRLCVVDGYMPAIAIPSRPHRAPCILLWHALGAIKKFGWQALGTYEGRTREQAEVGCMHRGYDVVVAGLSDAVPALSAGLDVEEKSVLPLGLPRLDYLTSDAFAEQRSADARAVLEACGWGAAVGSGEGQERPHTVLYAPTLRRVHGDDASSIEMLKRNAEDLVRALPGNWRMLVAAHPLNRADMRFAEGERVRLLPGGFRTVQALCAVDVVVTDYSAIAYEAAAARRRVLFYVPDIEAYRADPGLNIVPTAAFGQAAFERADLFSEVLEKGCDAAPRLLSSPVPGHVIRAIGALCEERYAG